MRTRNLHLVLGSLVLIGRFAQAQLIDQTKAPNVEGNGIRKSYAEQIGAGRGDWSTPDSSAFIIARDPFRAIRRGRQLFNRKFTKEQRVGPIVGDGRGDINTKLELGAGLSDSCAGCHGLPRGSAGFGGVVVTRPDSRNAPHLFGLGLREMLGDEVTAELRARRDEAISAARTTQSRVVRPLSAKGIEYGEITANPDGTVDLSKVRGVDRDLRVRPFFAHGGAYSIRDFIVVALQNELGMQAVDPDLAQAAVGRRVVTPAGMLLDGSLDRLDHPPAADASADPDGDGVVNEAPQAVVDFLEFYLLNYFKPAHAEQNEITAHGREIFNRAGCDSCHIADRQIDRDRRVADVETVHDPVNGIFNTLYATATPLFETVDDSSGFYTVKQPALKPFLVRDIFTDFKRHDLGPSFHERDYDGTMRKEFMTLPLWGVGSTPPYGHDGRSMTLNEVILRHGGEAQQARDAYAALGRLDRQDMLDFLNSLILFPPDDTASNLNPGNRSAADFPQRGHGSIALTVLFNNASDPE
ncbi:MAG: di-heme oxidoredictase family protein [Bryobacteraceae bacterium]